MEKDARISFRANSAIQAGLALCADKLGCTVSEYVRQAVEERLAKEAETTLGLNVYTRLADAARGSLQAQREIAHQAVQMAFMQDDKGEFLRDPQTCLIEGLVFARLAAAQGDAGDQGTVVAMLALITDICGEENCPEEMAEIIARIAAVADSGETCSEEVARWLPSIVEGCSPEAVDAAKVIRAAMLEGEKA